VKKSNPTALIKAARPPIRKAMAPAATTKAVADKANLESDLIGLPSSSNAGTNPVLRTKSVFHDQNMF
jgi:hypothetical protein